MKKFLFLSLICLIIAILFYGCAGVSIKEPGQVYYIKGLKYYALEDLCKLNNIAWQWDFLGEVASLESEGHKVRLMPGSNLVLLDDKPVDLKIPVMIENSKLLVPDSFKTLVLERIVRYVATTEVKHERFVTSKRIIIDAGHGGRDVGAMGASHLEEKEVVLDIACRLANKLKAKGANVAMTRTKDVFVPLERRSEIANEEKGDLFISIHANANHRKSLSGIEVYYLTNNVDDSLLAAKAANLKEVYCNGETVSSQPSTVRSILWDMLYTDNRRESFRLASKISRSLNRYTGLVTLGVKPANFSVLRLSLMPAVLVEVGYISNKADEKKLASSSFREQIAEGLTAAIIDYLQSPAADYY